MITGPGLYSDPAIRAAYHEDPCPEPSLSRSIAKALVDRTPGHAKAYHPRLTPQPAKEYEDNGKFDLGSAAHKLLLNEGSEIEVIDADNFRTKDAQLKRDIAYGAGKIPLLRSQYDRAVDMVEAVHKQLPSFGLQHLFRDGESEVVGAWIDPVAGWCRVMADRLMPDLTIWDVKTTDIPISLERLGRMMSGLQYEWQPAFYERCIENLYPEMRGRVVFNFLFVEVRQPFAILPVRLSSAAMAKGRANVERACRLWAKCKERGQWPLFSGEIATVEYPPWAVAEWMGDGE